MQPKSPQFNRYVYKPSNDVTLSRGLWNTAAEDVDTEGTGHHWTASNLVAESFINQDHTGPRDGVVLSGTMAKKDTFDPSSKNLSKRQRKFVRNNNVYTDDSERETTAKVDKPVKNLSALEYEDDKLVRGRFYGSGNTGRAAIGRS